MSSNQIKTQTKLKSMHRRQFGRVAVGVLAVVGLAACGGGSGSEGETTSSLREAYDKINDGMTKEDVLSIVGREPDYKAYDNWVFRTDTDTLMIHYGSYRDMPGVHVTGARWETTDDVRPSGLSK